MIWRFPKIRGTTFGGPNIADYSIWGCILGSPNLGKLPYKGKILFKKTMNMFRGCIGICGNSYNLGFRDLGLRGLEFRALGSGFRV